MRSCGKPKLSRCDTDEPFKVKGKLALVREADAERDLLFRLAGHITPGFDLVSSRSYCITSPTEVRTRTLDQVRELLASHPALANSAGLALPYVAIVSW